jgi:CRISPR-associated protein Csd1
MTILQALKGYYDRVTEREPTAIAAPGYSDEKISFAVVIDADGKVVANEDLRDTDGRKPLPLLVPVPASFKRPGKTPKSFFLWDKTAFALGATEGGENELFATSLKQHEAFRRIHLDNLANEQDAGLAALRRFVETWSPDNFSKLTHAAEMLDTNVVFRLNGEAGFIHDRPAAKDIWRKVRASIGADSSQCLVTGEQEPVARLHPAIKNIPGQTMGGSIVSFNLNAFTSYGLEQGDNAPVSETAAFGYTTALNRLLRADSRNRIQLADATTVFWGEAEVGADAEAAEGFFSCLSAPPDDADATAKMRPVMERMEQGRPLDIPELHFKDGTKFYILGLSPNASRLSVRFWEMTTLGGLGRAFHRHFKDLSIEPKPWNAHLPAIKRLLVQTALLGDSDRIPPSLAGELMRAILTERRYPQTLLSQAIIRLRSDRTDKTQTRTALGLRAALIKACITRDFRFNIEKEDVPVNLDRSNMNPGYRLGRLFAVLEGVQSVALPGLNATIRDRFYAAASATPSSVFPILISKSNHHLSNLKKTDKGGLAVWFEREIGEIIGGFPAGEFPRLLKLQDQGRFAIGYYQQGFTKRADTPTEIAAPDTTARPDTDA